MVFLGPWFKTLNKTLVARIGARNLLTSWSTTVGTDGDEILAVLDGGMCSLLIKDLCHMFKSTRTHFDAPLC